MTLFRTKENAQRKYIDLIKEAAAKWPNWDPAKNIYVSIVIHPFVRQSVWPSLGIKQAGDFGTIDRKTGDLTVEGNIYKHIDIAQIAKQYPPEDSPDLDYYQIPSYEVRPVDHKAEARK
jgi:hypothetical protein